MKLNDREWGIFFIGDLFSVNRPPARNKDDYEVGDKVLVEIKNVNYKKDPIESKVVFSSLKSDALKVTVSLAIRFVPFW